VATLDFQVRLELPQRVWEDRDSVTARNRGGVFPRWFAAWSPRGLRHPNFRHGL